MSFQERPSYQRPTISSSLPSVTPAKRTPGSVPLVRGLSPVRSPYYGRAQEVDAQRSHDNPLFRNRASDANERRSGLSAVDTSPLRTAKCLKENAEVEEPWKVHVEKVQTVPKQGCTTPGKTSRLGAMPFTTPPKPIAKRKILSESNRDVSKPLSFSASRKGDEITSVEESQIAAAPAAKVAKVASPLVEKGARKDADRRLSELNTNKPDEQHSTMASIEELQQRIQKFLNTETRVETPVLPLQRNESPERRSGENGTATYQPAFSSYSPRPELPRSRTRSSSPTSVEVGEEELNVRMHDRSPVRTMEKATTPSGYDPKTNYLSPRPQFLRYRPQKRLEMLRNSAEYLNLDLDSSPTDSSANSANNEVQPDSPTSSIKLESEMKSFSSEEEGGVYHFVANFSKVELETESINMSTESRPLEYSEVSTLRSRDAEEDIVEYHSEEYQVELREENEAWDCRMKLREEHSPRNEVNATVSISVTSTLTCESHEISESHEHAPESHTLQESKTGLVLPDHSAAPECATVEVSKGEPTHDAPQVNPSTTPDGDTVQESIGELDVEDIDLPEIEEIRSLSGRIFRTLACVFVVLGFTLLALCASGSPGLLPESLCHNEVAEFWRTSEYTAPVRTFLGSVEGLWKEPTGFSAYPVEQRHMEILGTKLQDVRNAMADFDSQKAIDLIGHLYSTSAAYVAPLSGYITRTYLHVRKWLSDAAEAHPSRATETEEWGWVPEYDFIVAKDVPDWADAYETILAIVDSWEVKSIFQSYIDSNRAQGVHEFIDESSVDADLDETSISPDTEPSSVEIQLADYTSSTLPLPVEVSESPNIQFTHSDIERDSVGVKEEELLESEDQDELFGSSASAVEVAVDDTVVPLPSEATSVEPPTVILSEGGSVASFRGEIADVGSGGRVEGSEDAADLSWNSVESGVHRVDPVEEGVHAADLVQYSPEQQLESLSSETAIEDTLGPDETSSSESILPNTMVGDTEAEASAVSLQPKFSYVMSPAVLTASVASLLVASAIAVVLLKPAQKSVSRVLRKRKGDAWEKHLKPIDANGARATKGKLPRKPQRTFKIATNSQPLDSGSNPLPGDYGAHATMPSDYAEQFSTPLLFSEKAYSKTPVDRSAYLSPEKSSRPLTDNSSFLSPDIEVVEDSSLGRFTALVPVVHNEGTEKQEVKLTPVRRSSRIRSRLQSPSHTLSHFSYSP
ncbi:hypothetical protein R1sor_005233 [Riccia sorocarpa]|uniref:Uncharacterized protein n=1 Tax=Riccia sorocarpa TaxID=122646 RepID=A0ABD3HLY0_9MARC